MASTGLDSNPGTQAQPWQTIGKVNTAIATGTVACGDTVYFNRGDTFSDAALLVESDCSASTVLTIDAYGSGNNPIFNAGGSQKYSMRASNGSWIAFKNFKAIISWNGVDGYGVNVVNATNISISDCETDGSATDQPTVGIEVNDSPYFRIQNCTIHDQMQGINVLSNPGHPGFIFGNTIYNSIKGTEQDWDGIRIRVNAVAGSSDNFSGLIIAGNDVSAWKEDGIDAKSAGHLVIEDNYFHDPVGDYTITGFKIGNSTGSNSDKGSGDIIRRNLLKNIGTGTNGIGIGLYEGAHEIYSNIIDTSDGSGIHAFGVGNGIDGTHIYNNTIVKHASRAIRIEGDVTSIYVKNNILDGIAPASDFIVRTGVVVHGGFNILKNAASVANSGGTYTGSANDLYATDPLFTDYTNRNYSLASGSPAANAGVSVSTVLYDYRGISKSTTPSIGAIEDNKSVETEGLILNGTGIN